MDKQTYLENVYNSAFEDELEKVSSSASDLGEAFYNAQKKIDKERISADRKKKLIGTGILLATSGGIYGAHKLGLTKNMMKNLDDKIMSSAKDAGNTFGRAAGEASNAAAEGFKNTIKSGASEYANKVRGGNFLKKIIKKMIFKG